MSSVQRNAIWLSTPSKGNDFPGLYLHNLYLLERVEQKVKSERRPLIPTATPLVAVAVEDGGLGVGGGRVGGRRVGGRGVGGGRVGGRRVGGVRVGGLGVGDRLLQQTTS